MCSIKELNDSAQGLACEARRAEETNKNAEYYSYSLEEE